MSAVSPIVIQANHYHFAPAETKRNGPVLSLMQLWCRTGRGTVEANGQRYALPPGQAVLLPWRHTIRYLAERREPFLVSGIHIIAGASHAHPVQFGQVMHNGEEHPGISEGEHPLGGSVHPVNLSDHPTLAHLSEYVLLCYLRGNRQEHEQRANAERMLSEWSRVLKTAAAPEPPALARARVFITSHLNRRLDREALAQSGGVSPATLQRISQTHLGVSPMAWASQLRLEAAASLVAGSSLPLQAIAERFGYYDAFHFSRAFKRHHGMAPAIWRRRHALLSDS